MNLKYKFLNYVANGNGIKFGLNTDVSSVLRFDHSFANAPGSTKLNPVQVIRNSIQLNQKSTVASCENSCGVSVPVAVNLSWSGPATKTEDVASGIDTVIAALTAYRSTLTAGFLPTTADIDLVVGE